MHVDKRLDLRVLDTELKAAAVPFTVLSERFDPGSGPTGPTYSGDLVTYDASGAEVDLPPSAQPVVDAHVPPPQPFRYALVSQVSSVLRTTDDLEHDVFVLPAELKSIYRAELTMSAIDAGNGAIKTMTGILVWKRLAGANVTTPPSNITVLSQINDTAAASWIMNGLPSGGSFRIFVKGQAGRTIDWHLQGPVGRFAPDGL